MHCPRMRVHRLRRCVIALLTLSLTFALVADAQRNNPTPRVTYTVEVRDPATKLFHVTATFSGLAQKSLDLSLPVWTPGWYTIENYAKNVAHFTVTGGDGSRRPHTMPRRQTWRVDVDHQSHITVCFDYSATVLALNQAKITADFAFFTGTELFVMAEGMRAVPVTVRFLVPSGWRISTALDQAGDSTVYRAPNYDVLVDAPTMLGHFDVTQFEAGGRPHYLVAEPAGAFGPEKTAQMTALLRRVVRVDSAMFGSLPYKRYFYFYHFARAESNASGALEHLNSHVLIAGPAASVEPQDLIAEAAHEYFHLWNVKRIRPIEMWPYDYARENETPLLWVSEGITSYYGDASLQRAGIRTVAQRLAALAHGIDSVEGNDARRHMSVAEASSSTWLCYDTPCRSAVSYYPWGEALGALLDLSLRHDSRGRASLDDVMRVLYRERYERGQGFSTDDLTAIFHRLSGRDYRPFFKRYVWGTDVPPYTDILGYAGYQLLKGTRIVGTLGAGTDSAANGVRLVNVVVPSAAAAAGLAVGDVLTTVDGAPLHLGSFADKAGRTVTVNYLRGGESRTTSVVIGSITEPEYTLREVPSPTEGQLSLRAAWLATAPDRSGTTGRPKGM
ncbi:MAG: PDZ domain-containing protein [Gemmatimonadaceae bacterium]